MNIQAITPSLFNKTGFNQKNNNTGATNVITPNYLENLPQDTVSFSGLKMPKKAVKPMEKLVLDGYQKNHELYVALGNRLMDTSEVIARKFEKRGVKFYRSYCEHGVIKSDDSFLSKFLRSGENPYDRVRTTQCIDNPYDFRLIRDILDEYRLRDYRIFMMPDKMSGRRVLSRKPDFDIRLPGVTEEDTKVLGPELQKCIGKPLKSGYSDIQMRVVDVNSRKSDAPTLEILFVFGKHTLAAKEAESYYSYDIRRALKNELRVNSVKTPKINTPAYRVQNNIDIICDILENQISKPLFFNAKNKDFLHTTEQLPVGLNETSITTVYGLFDGTRTKISKHYSDEIKKVLADEYKPELERVFKESEEYIERTDKTVYVQDLQNTKRQIIKDIKQQKENDLELLAAAKERFIETANTDFSKKIKEITAKIK